MRIVAIILTLAFAWSPAFAETEQPKPTPFFREMMKKKTQTIPNLSHSPNGINPENQRPPRHQHSGQQPDQRRFQGMRLKDAH